MGEHPFSLGSRRGCFRWEPLRQDERQAFWLCRRLAVPIGKNEVKIVTDNISQCREVMHEIRNGTDQSVLDAMSRLQVTFAQLDERLRMYDDSIMANLINSRKFRVALEAYRQGCRHASSAVGSGNEINLLASRIGSPGATDLGYALLAAGADLGVADRRGMNGLYSMAFAVMIPSNRNEETKAFLSACIQSASRQAVYAKNKAGVSAWDLIHARCTEDLINLAEKIHGQ